MVDTFSVKDGSTASFVSFDSFSFPYVSFVVLSSTSSLFSISAFFSCGGSAGECISCLLPPAMPWRPATAPTPVAGPDPISDTWPSWGSSAGGPWGADPKCAARRARRRRRARRACLPACRGARARRHRPSRRWSRGHHRRRTRTASTRRCGGRTTRRQQLVLTR